MRRKRRRVASAVILFIISAAMNSGMRLIFPNGTAITSRVHSLLATNAVTSMRRFCSPVCVLTFKNDDQSEGEPSRASSQGIFVSSQATGVDEATLAESDNLTQATASRKSGVGIPVDIGHYNPSQARDAV
ncbi:hypothetical protein ON010_g12444 [Phytophthora cinnamomi]|nr:hypothetical protein ON010_g12444 [Phytophthora cinnamomi]